MSPLIGGRRAAHWSLLAASLVVLLGLGLTSALVQSTRAGQSQAAATAFERRADLAASAVRAELRRYQDTILTVAGALSGDQLPTGRQFRAVTAPLRRANLAGASSIDFVVPVPADHDLAAVAERWRRLGVDPTFRPATGVTEHKFILFSRTFDDLAFPPGGDVANASAPTAALDTARRSWQPAISSTYVLLRDRDRAADRRQLSFVLAAPVRAASGEFLGWVQMPLRGGDLMRRTLTTELEGRANATLDASSAASQGVVAVAQVRNGEPAHKLPERQVMVAIGQRQWVLRLQATAAGLRLDGDSPQLPTALAQAGVMISLLLGTVVYLLLASRRRALQAVRRATAELKRANAETRRQAGLLTATLDSMSDAVVAMDENKRVLLSNPAARAMRAADPAASQTDRAQLLPEMSPEEWGQEFEVRCSDGTAMPLEDLPLLRALRGEVVTGEMSITPVGTQRYRWFSVSARPLEEGSGMVGAVAVLRDVTEQRAADDQLREAEERFRFAFDRAPTGMAMTLLGEPDADPADAGPAGGGSPEGGPAAGSNLDGAAAGQPRRGSLVRVNQALCDMLGYRQEELLTRTFGEITHPDDREHDAREIARIAAAGEVAYSVKKRYLHADGHPVWARVNATLIRDGDGELRYAVTQIEDITAQHVESERLSTMALQDGLTGLGNRVLLMDRLQQAVSRTARSERPLAVLFCDVDGFKPINDEHGHAAGDDVLRELAQRLRRAVRPADTVVRLGGDEFVVLCEDLVEDVAAEVVRQRIIAATDAPIRLRSGADVRVGASVGVVTAAGAGLEPDELMAAADREMYRAKTARLRARGHSVRLRADHRRGPVGKPGPGQPAGASASGGR